jgi:hypothetical protein
MTEGFLLFAKRLSMDADFTPRGKTPILEDRGGGALT